MMQKAVGWKQKKKSVNFKKKMVVVSFKRTTYSEHPYAIFTYNSCIYMCISCVRQIPSVSLTPVFIFEF